MTTKPLTLTQIEHILKQDANLTAWANEAAHIVEKPPRPASNRTDDAIFAGSCGALGAVLCLLFPPMVVASVFGIGSLLAVLYIERRRASR